MGTAGQWLKLYQIPHNNGNSNGNGSYVGTDVHGVQGLQKRRKRTTTF